jgi:hypothetical protein
MTAETVAVNNVEKLPKHCLARDRIGGQTVILMRGKRGAVQTSTKEIPEAYNHRLGLTYEQIDAMEYGSTLGFDVPLADPDYVRRVRTELGQPVGPIPAPTGQAEKTAAAAASATAAPAPKHQNSVLTDAPELNLLPEFIAA